ncbi:hypothetical protein NDN08_007769 [Rhodosorus marinus]|uniref:Uncharacterized protein n=1 Tax=Rhodosorus marinus TaxID=101924 RepID=A0AAV8UZP3_9RHOD|nr:hypothetical protein NDN08_007769 [Rhodosorus marinus]
MAEAARSDIEPGRLTLYVLNLQFTVFKRLTCSDMKSYYLPFTFQSGHLRKSAVLSSRYALSRRAFEHIRTCLQERCQGAPGEARGISFFGRYCTRSSLPLDKEKAHARVRVDQRIDVRASLELGESWISWDSKKRRRSLPSASPEWSSLRGGDGPGRK